MMNLEYEIYFVFKVFYVWKTITDSSTFNICASLKFRPKSNNLTIKATHKETKNMILTTTNSVEGSRIVEYKGVVTGISYNSSYSHKGNNMSFKDMFKMSKYYEAYAAGLEQIKEEAFQKLKDNAEALNANAVVGISVDVEALANSNTLMVSVTGTAVSIAKT